MPKWPNSPNPKRFVIVIKLPDTNNNEEVHRSARLPVAHRLQIEVCTKVAFSCPMGRLLLLEKMRRLPKTQSLNNRNEASQIEIVFGILVPFVGTTLGAACVFFMKRPLRNLVQRSLAGFAAGVMVAASIWSLLIPAIEQSASMGRWSFFSGVFGVLGWRIVLAYS